MNQPQIAAGPDRAAKNQDTPEHVTESTVYAINTGNRGALLVTGVRS